MGGGGQGKNKKIEIKIEPYYLYKFVLAFRESTFITPRGGDEDVLKKAHIFTGLLLRLLVNFDATPSKFLKFSMPPPPLEFGIEEVQSGILSYHRYNLQFLKMSDILKHVLLLNKTTDLLLLSPH
jgi:hypothetical protein